ncbi:hypothetical protein QE385_000433 [Sphingomonas sp. SORGH_AS 950]|uniref:DUF4435 domain-containing protein n=1 Tax=Sphingomonas sp. SORGH_AS_0950 TaxID=3041792 RepID=UPI0027814595|nr:DUF4435 domain-containing protein [Sphingomonas sp. SORGH_AS_0950]MDQ1156106.1 hypothetical protein [Sphingomonas sp. SORGH_AS_0950]
MDDYAEYLAEEAKSDIAALHQFKILYDPDQTSFHFFFEGEEDSLFYIPEARRRVGNGDIYLYDCGGKKNVIDVRDAIKSDDYETRNCLFFVDRDFDDILGCQVYVDDSTYITDNYSIENDISSIDSLQIILEDVLHLSRANPEFSSTIRFVKQAFDSFYIEVRSLIAWILAAKQGGCSPNLSNTNGLKGIVSFSDGKPSLCAEGFLEFKKKVVVNGRLPALSAIIRFNRYLDPSTPKAWVRGKYDIWFFQVALLAALEVANERRAAAGQRKIKIPSSIREGRIFEVLGGRVLPPLSLQSFYDRRLH